MAHELHANAGSTAFPVVFDDVVTKSREVYSGMSLRDYFAGQALSGFIHRYHEDSPVSPDPIPDIARVSYEYADAMLKEREK